MIHTVLDIRITALLRTEAKQADRTTSSGAAPWAGIADAFVASLSRILVCI